MNVVSRGIKNALRSPMRSISIVLMLAISIGLMLSMLVARSSVNAKVEEVKSTTGTSITISPAGVFGFAGGGNALTSEQLDQIIDTEHIVSTVATLSDQMDTSDTSLTPSLELGDFGSRQMRFEGSSSTNGSGASQAIDAPRPTPTPRTTVTGTTDPNSISVNGSALSITSGSTIDGNSTDLVALVGSDLATKNNLAINDTFTAYTKTIKVVGVYTTGSKFQDSGIIMPLATVQTLTDQAGKVSSVVAKIDNSDNVSITLESLKTTLGEKADIVSQEEQAASSVASLESISNLAFAGVVGSAIAGSVIILLTMIMIVRERRREIGVIKAIGGTNSKVIYQFISEALTLTMIGAIVGLTLGVIVSGPMTSSLVSGGQSNSIASTQNGDGGPVGFARRSLYQVNAGLTQVTSSVTPETFASAIGIILLISIVGSAVPAWFIARIRPAEVLRSE